jgi:hypothetical protein
MALEGVRGAGQNASFIEEEEEEKRKRPPRPAPSVPPAGRVNPHATRAQQSQAERIAAKHQGETVTISYGEPLMPVAKIEEHNKQARLVATAISEAATYFMWSKPQLKEKRKKTIFNSVLGQVGAPVFKRDPETNEPVPIYQFDPNTVVPFMAAPRLPGIAHDPTETYAEWFARRLAIMSPLLGRGWDDTDVLTAISSAYTDEQLRQLSNFYSNEFVALQTMISGGLRNRIADDVQSLRASTTPGVIASAHKFARYLEDEQGFDISPEPGDLFGIWHDAVGIVTTPVRKALGAIGLESSFDALVQTGGAGGRAAFTAWSALKRQELSTGLRDVPTIEAEQGTTRPIGQDALEAAGPRNFIDLFEEGWREGWLGSLVFALDDNRKDAPNLWIVEAAVEAAAAFVGAKAIGAKRVAKKVPLAEGADLAQEARRLGRVGRFFYRDLAKSPGELVREKHISEGIHEAWKLSVEGRFEEVFDMFPQMRRDPAVARALANAETAEDAVDFMDDLLSGRLKRLDRKTIGDLETRKTELDAEIADREMRVRAARAELDATVGTGAPDKKVRELQRRRTTGERLLNELKTEQRAVNFELESSTAAMSSGLITQPPRLGPMVNLRMAYKRGLNHRAAKDITNKLYDLYVTHNGYLDVKRTDLDGGLMMDGAARGLGLSESLIEHLNASFATGSKVTRDKLNAALRDYFALHRWEDAEGFAGAPNRALLKATDSLSSVAQRTIHLRNKLEQHSLDEALADASLPVEGGPLSWFTDAPVNKAVKLEDIIDEAEQAVEESMLRLMTRGEMDSELYETLADLRDDLMDGRNILRYADVDDRMVRRLLERSIAEGVGMAAAPRTMSDAVTQAGTKVRETLLRKATPYWERPIDFSPAGVSEATLALSRFGQHMKIPRRVVDDIIDRYVAADNPSARRQAVYDLETEAIRREKNPAVREALKEGRSNLFGADNALYTARADKTGGNWKLVREDGRVLHQPLTSKQLADTHYLPNPGAISELRKAPQLLENLSGNLRRSGQGLGKRLVGGAAYELAQTWSYTSRGARFIAGSVWAPAQLAFRPVAYLMTTLIDDQARLAVMDAPTLWTHPIDYFRAVTRTPDAETKAGISSRRVVSQMFSDESIVGDVPGYIHKSAGNYPKYWGERLRLLHVSDETRYLAKHGRAKTREWLTDGAGQPTLRRMKESVLDQMGKTVDDWLDALEDEIAYITRGDEKLTRLISHGKMRNGDELVRIGDASGLDESLIRHLGSLDAELRPEYVAGMRTATERAREGVWQSIVHGIIDNTAARTSDRFARIPLYNSLYDNEFSRLKSLGIPETRAAEQAAKFAKQRVHKELFELSDRSSFAANIRGLAPFFGAYEEVFKKWMIDVPATHGVGFGHIYYKNLLHRFGVLGQELGFATQNEEGEWNIRAPFVNNLLALLPGLDADDLPEIDLPLSTWFNMGQEFPASGPGLQMVASSLVKALPGLEEDLNFLLPYGASWPELFPAAVVRTSMGLTGQSPSTNPRVREQQLAASAVAWMRSNVDDILPSLKSATVDERQQLLDEFVDTAFEKARSLEVARGVLGLAWPRSYIRYWEGQEDAQKMADLYRTLSDTEREQLRSEHPELALYLIGSYRSKDGFDEANEQEDRALGRVFAKHGFEIDPEGASEFVNKRFRGEVEIKDPKLMAELLAGQAEYEEARQRRDEGLRALGDSGADLIQNASAASALRREFRSDMLAIGERYPRWKTERARAIEEWTVLDGKPLANERQRRFDEVADAVVSLEILLAQQGIGLTPEERKNAKAFVAQMREKSGYSELFDDDSYIDSLPEGPAKQEALWFRDHYGPYLDEMSKVFEGAENLSSDEFGRRLEAWRKTQNEMSEKPVKIDGVEYPSPQAYSYLAASDRDRDLMEAKWAALPRGFLTNTQRQIIGLPVSQAVEDYWDVVNETERRLSEWQAKNRYTSSQKEYRQARDAVDQWKEDLAKWYARPGIGFPEVQDDYLADESFDYQRVNQADIDLDTAFAVFNREADAIHNQLAALGKSPSSKEGERMIQPFVERVIAMRQKDESFAEQLGWFEQTLYGGDKSRDMFIKLFWFDRSFG